MKKILAAIAAVGVLGAGGALAYLSLRQPASAPPRAGGVPMTPERIARGKHLFENLADCGGCHSAHDETRFGRPVLPGGTARGFVFPTSMGLPGAVTAPNLTPDRETGLGEWTDGEKIRAIREGLSKDGRVLFPMMPYETYREMSDEDVESIVAYLNSLPPVRNALPRTKINFPVVLLMKGAPQPVAGPLSTPPSADRLAWGRYLTAMAGCAICHTPIEGGPPDPAKRFGGGQRFVFPHATVVSANISSDPETGIGRWSEAQFLDKVYQYKDYDRNGSPVIGPSGYTVMPWLTMSRLSPEELGAIFAYLKSQPPVKNAVETHPGHS